MTKKIRLSALIVISLFILSCKSGSKEKTTINNTKESAVKVKETPKEKIIPINKKLLIGSWFDTSESALHFTIGYNGTAHSDNMATLLYQKWHLEDNIITFTIKSIGNHTSSVSDESYIIEKLDNDVLILKSKFSTEKYYRRHPSITNIEAGQKIVSPLTIKVNSEAVWFASEGELGRVEIIDDKGNVLNKKDNWGILQSTDGNWMHSKPAFYNTIVEFDSKESKKGKIKVYSDPGEGDGDEAGIIYTFEVPITF